MVLCKKTVTLQQFENRASRVRRLPAWREDYLEEEEEETD